MSDLSNQTEQSLTLPHHEMILVQGGSFRIGSRERELEKGNSHPLINISSFYIGKYPVTQGLWKRVMPEKKNPSHFQGSDRPVENVSWYDAQDFIRSLNALTNQNYRLLSESEWEYAARGGQKSEGYLYAGGNKLKDVGWYNDNSYGETKPVGLKYPNELGLFDMSGNVWEWVEDQWHGNYDGAPKDGSAWVDHEEGARRVIRGGSWGNSPRLCRVTVRNDSAPTGRDGDLGFRLGLSLQSVG